MARQDTRTMDHGVMFPIEGGCDCRMVRYRMQTAPLVRLVRVGTLDGPDLLPPDIHILTRSRQPWAEVGHGAPSVPCYYDREAFWPPQSLACRQAIVPLIEAFQAAASRGSDA